VSFVAFTNTSYKEASEGDYKKLGDLGFRRPSTEYLERWEKPVEFDPEKKRPRQGRGGPERGRSATHSRDRGRSRQPLARGKSEPVRKGAQTSYKARGKKQRQEELFPDLLREIEKKRIERESGVHFTAEERFGLEFRKELAKLSMERIQTIHVHSNYQVKHFQRAQLGTMLIVMVME
jgi:hypothetical protein